MTDDQWNSGHAALDGHSLVISNLINGLDLYTIPTMERIKTFAYTIVRNFPMQVAIIPQTNWIVCGGDDGFVRIYHLRTGQILHQLDHGEGKDSFYTSLVFPVTYFIQAEN
jgi:WD40 repeat protein